MHWNIPSNSKWALDSWLYLLIHRVDDIRRTWPSKKMAGIHYTRYPVPGNTAREGKLARALSLSLRRGIALWTACFAKECLFLDQQRAREGREKSGSHGDHQSATDYDPAYRSSSSFPSLSWASLPSFGFYCVNVNIVTKFFFVEAWRSSLF